MVAPSLLAQDTPAAATPTTLFTIGQQTILKIFVSNTGGTADTFRIGLVPLGGALSADSYIAYDVPLGIGEAAEFSGISMDEGDEIHIYSTGGFVSFVATGLVMS